MPPRLIKWIFWISVLTNFVLLTFFSFYLTRNKEKLTQKFILATGDCDIVMFGDSHTGNANWNSLLRGQKVVTLGYNGFTSDQLKSMMMTDVLPLKTRYCFIQGGGADIRTHCFEKNVLINNIREMIDSLQMCGITPVLQTLFYRKNSLEYNLQVDSINSMLMLFSEKENVDFLNINDHLINENGLKAEYTIEGIHLNEEGYKVWAKVINEFLGSSKRSKMD
jgi:lysophospholipase L1-like esterase